MICLITGWRLCVRFREKREAWRRYGVSVRANVFSKLGDSCSVVCCGGMLYALRRFNGVDHAIEKLYTGGFDEVKKKMSRLEQNQGFLSRPRVCERSSSIKCDMKLSFGG